MRRRISGDVRFEKWIDEKFSLIYMEIQSDKERVAGDTGLIVPKRSTRWHLEDEQRPQQALCGFPLHGVCKSVSPGLAMLGTPCKDCANIVKDWISNAGKSHELVRVQSMVVTDFPFRRKVREGVDGLYFLINSPGDSEEEDKPLKKREKPKTRKPSRNG